MTGPIIFTWSTGKDSARALWELMQDDTCTVTALLTTVTSDYCRVSMHGVREELLEAQASSIGIPLEKVTIFKGATNEDYENAFTQVLNKYKDKGVKNVAFGDIYLEDLKEYREKNLKKIDMKALFPIWKMDTCALARDNLKQGFRTVVTCVDTEKLDGSFAGRYIDHSFLDDLPEGVDPCGENGEFHSFCYDGPIFTEPILFKIGETVLRDNRFMFCDLIPT